MPSTPKIMAHRGDAERFPENTLPALTAAAEGGADAVELDVQFLADGTPIVFRDADLARVTGVSGLVAQQSADALRTLSAKEPDRFQDRFEGTPIPTLAEAAEALAPFRSLEVFVEVKPDSLPWHSLPQGVQSVLEACQALSGRFVIVSAEERILREARSLSRDTPIGLVIPSWDSNELERAEVSKPQYLFVSKRVLPPPTAPLWQGPWEWVVYDVDDPATARDLGERGIAYIATRNVESMKKGLGGAGKD